MEHMAAFVEVWALLNDQLIDYVLTALFIYAVVTNS